MKHAVDVFRSHAKLSEYRSTYLHTQVRSWAALHGRHFFLREDGEVVPRETKDIMGEYLEYMHALRQALGNAVDSYGVIDLLKIPGDQQHEPHHHQQLLRRTRSVCPAPADHKEL
jgi:hypothetical protein